jgi:DNA-binding CsgD family transcriptional regulator
VEQFSNLLGHIYDAATDPRRWPAVLLEVAAFAGATFAALGVEDAFDPLRTVLHLSSPDSDWTRLCQEALLLGAPIARMADARTDDVTLAHHPRECGRRAVSVAVTIFEKTRSKLAFLSLARAGAGPEDEMAMQRSLALLAPHMRRAVSIAQDVTREQRRITALSQTLNRLSCAVFLIDPTGTIVHTNDHAAVMLSERLVLSAGTGKLFLHDPNARAALAQALQTPAPVNRENVFIVGARRETALLGQVTILADTAIDACAAFFIRPIRFDLPTDAARTVLATAHALTRREIGVLMAVVEAGGAPDAARRLGLTPETVKAHLKSIFRKTGAHNQVDLVKLVSSVSTAWH